MGVLSRVWAAAMGISKDYAVGEAFDQDLQELKKQERIEQRERDYEKRQQERKEVAHVYTYAHRNEGVVTA